MKKNFKFLMMVLLGLFAGVGSVGATNISGMTPEEAEANAFWARLAVKPATTTNGSGKVFVISAEDYSGDPDDGDYVAQMSADGWSDIFLASSIINANAQFRTFAKADNGSYFTGWSFTDGYTDLGTESSNFWVEVTPSSTKGHGNIRNYNLYAAFEPIRIVSYQITGNGTTVSGKCSFEVYFQPDATISLNDFNNPVVTNETGAGTWTAPTTGKKKWAVADGKLKVVVNLTDANAEGSYLATLTVTTKAGININVPLYARTVVAAPGNAVLYDGKTQMTSGTVEEMLAVNTSAYANPILKLSGDCSDAIAIDKKLTFDLNGYTLSNTLTVSGGNVTLAYSPFGGAISNNVSVTSGKLTLTGGTINANVNVSAGATLEQNGAAITGAVTNAGTMTTTDGSITGQLASSGTLTLNGGTFTNNSGIAVNITGGTADIKRGTISGSTYGVQTKAGVATIGKLAAVTGSTKALYGNGGSLTVNNGKFSDPAELIAGTVTFNAGYFQTNNAGETTALGKQVWRNTAGTEFREGYNFFAGDQAAAQASNVSVCRIGQTSYSSLEDALAYANNNPNKGVIIIMENDYVLPAGYYTLPAKATLIVPMSNDQETDNPIVPRQSSGSPAPVSFRRLTFASGVNMEVAGTLEVSCTQYGTGETMGIPGGNYGHLILKPGSHMTINNGGYLRAWGFVTGDGTKDGEGNYLSGEIDVRRGGTVHEMFQMGDWKGGDISFTIAMEVPGMTNWRDMAHLFPVYMYFIQNVESPVKYHPGASLICATSVNVSGNINAYANDIKVVGKEGEPAMFLMDEMADAENTWVRKYYDAKKDQQVYEVNSGAKLGSMVIDLGEVPGSFFGASGTLNLVLDSRKFVLPLTSNFKIHLLSGYMQFTQSTSCLPGMEVEIDKESEISIVNQHNDGIVQGALYFYDADQWSFQNSQAKGYVGNSGKFGAIVRYSPTWDLETNGATTKPNVRNISSPAAIGDAILNVHGTFRMGEGCAVYTTWSKNMETFQLDDSESASGGANIISSNEDAGTFIFDADVPAFDGLNFDGEGNIVGFGPNVIVNYDHNDYGLGSQYPVQINTVLGGDNKSRVFGFELCTSAKLKNGDGTFATTDGTEAGKSYCYIDNRWTLMEVDEDQRCFMKDNYGTFYAKPADYVAIVGTKRVPDGFENQVIVGNDDHTYSDKAGAGRLFILTDGCQWWEVENVDNLYHCVHPLNDTYYYWVDDPDEEDPYFGEWKEKKFTITWKNWDGTEIKSYDYGNLDGDGNPTEIEYRVTYGTMAEYLGSNPKREENIDYTYDFTGWQPALGPVTQDVTYTATYVEQPRKYTIIFQNEGGTEIERQFLTHNEMPACENVPTRTGFTLQWEPAIAAVTGDATYRATWLEEPPTEYAITFFDYDGTTKLKPTDETPYMVAVGAMPIAPANPANKPATKEFTYVFDHWSPALEEVSLTSAKSYTAVYREVAKTYTVIFQNEDGSEIERNDYPYGATPVCSTTPTKANTAQYTYSFAWTPNIQTVQRAATYRAVFTPTTNKYTVTLLSATSGACTFTGAGVYEYGATANIRAIPASGYEFVEWQETHSTEANLGAQTVTGNITLTAVLESASPANLEIAEDASVTLDVPVTREDLIITSDGVHSGELINANYLTLTGEANFDLAINAQANTWYAIAVPWQVEVSNGITVNGVRQQANSDFYMAYYDGSIRAAQGKVDACWKYMTSSSIMQPGVLYMLYMTHAASTIRFRKKADAALLTTTLSVQAHPQSTSNEADAGWNGIANPALFHGYLNPSASTYSHPNFGQKYNPSTEQYDAIDMSQAANELIVGAPVFVQVAADKNFSIYDNWSDAAAHVPTRRANVDNSYYEVQISSGEEYTDRIYLFTQEDKEDRYVIGLDLAKAGTSTKVAQMWVDRYNTKLCVNTTAPIGKTATYPLGISVPQEGEYYIYPATDLASNQEMYVTYDGRAIWNLAYGPYMVNLPAGTHTQYGLKLIQRESPAVTTDVEQITNDQSQIQKVLIDNTIYIIREGAVYTINGQKVK